MRRPYLKPALRRLPIASEQPLCNVSLPDIGFGGDLDASTAPDLDIQAMEDELWK